jgi:hypothetical protein
LSLHGEPGQFQKKDFLRLQSLLDYALEARAVGAPNAKEDAQLRYRIGKIYYDLGVANGFDPVFHRKSLDELKNISSEMRKHVVVDMLNRDGTRQLDPERRDELQALEFWNNEYIKKK